MKDPVAFAIVGLTEEEQAEATDQQRQANGADGPHTNNGGGADQIAERDTEEFRPPEFTDEALALKFAERNKDHLRYVAKWGRWLIYDGKRWAEDETLHAYDLSRRVCREAAHACNKPKIASAMASAKTVAAVERLSRADRRLAATVDQWDRDDWLLNTPDGVVDLRTGQTSPHRASDHFTKITSVAPRGQCPKWLAFLGRVTDGNADLMHYLARVLGYGATGSTKEHALFFGYGTGGNGKSVLLNTVAGVLGDYHRTAPIETFTASTTDRHPTELAGLRGARLVTAIETEEGRRWAETRIKILTGGDKIPARFMRQDFFEYTPRFKLMIAGNHKPALRTIDEAIRRRFNLIPFCVTIPKSERDPDLHEKLKTEWPGILQWIIEGCRAWQEGGLLPPKLVTDATEAYLDAEDALMAWIDERCMCDPQAWTKSSVLFGDWKDWAVNAGEPTGTQKLFSQNMESRGFARRKGRTGNGFEGLQLITRMTG